MHPTTRGIALKIGATLAFSLQYAFLKLGGCPGRRDRVLPRLLRADSTGDLLPLHSGSARDGADRPALAASRPRRDRLVRHVPGLRRAEAAAAGRPSRPTASCSRSSRWVLAALMLKETVGPYRGAAVVAGFFGVILMLQPQGGALSIAAHGLSAGAALALAGSLMLRFRGDLHPPEERDRKGRDHRVLVHVVLRRARCGHDALVARAARLGPGGGH